MYVSFELDLVKMF